MQQGEKNIRVKGNLEDKGANGNSNNAGRWRGGPGLATSRLSYPTALSGEEPVASQRPLGSLGLKKGKLQAKMA